MQFKEEEEDEHVVLDVLEVEVEFKEEEEQVIWGVLEVEVEFKEEEEAQQVIWWVLEVEVEFKEAKEEEQVVLSVGGRRGVQGGRGVGTDDLAGVGGRVGV